MTEAEYQNFLADSDRYLRGELAEPPTAPPMSESLLNKAVTWRHFHKMLDDIAGVIGKHTRDKAILPIQALQKRVAELEARPVVAYQGTWAASKSYAEGSLVTHQGGLWLCQKSTNAKPPSGQWRLIVKSGKAA